MGKKRTATQHYMRSNLQIYAQIRSDIKVSQFKKSADMIQEMLIAMMK